ncbi:hypothetical protein AnigIFM56816_005234 [Aspergillus niger]|nr:hypothetical protein AnigIFM56816_005234 [Aspergillus niger]
MASLITPLIGGDYVEALRSWWHLHQPKRRLQTQFSYPTKLNHGQSLVLGSWSHHTSPGSVGLEPSLSESESVTRGSLITYFVQERLLGQHVTGGAEATDQTPPSVAQREVMQPAN